MAIGKSATLLTHVTDANVSSLQARTSVRFPPWPALETAELTQRDPYRPKQGSVSSATECKPVR